jgi:hypothetical protein
LPYKNGAARTRIVGRALRLPVAANIRIGCWTRNHLRGKFRDEIVAGFLKETWPDLSGFEDIQGRKPRWKICVGFPALVGTVMIRKLKSGGYRLYSRKKNPKTGKRRNLGTFKTRAAAKKHERAVQFFKRG